MTDSTGPQAEITESERLVHEFKNHLSVIVGFSDLLLRELAESDPRRADIAKMHKAANAALELLPRLSILKR